MSARRNPSTQQPCRPFRYHIEPISRVRHVKPSLQSRKCILVHNTELRRRWNAMAHCGVNRIRNSIRNSSLLRRLSAGLSHGRLISLPKLCLANKHNFLPQPSIHRALHTSLLRRFRIGFSVVSDELTASCDRSEVAFGAVQRASAGLGDNAIKIKPLLDRTLRTGYVHATCR